MFKNTAAVREGLEAKIPSIHSLTFLIGNAGDAIPPHAAVILISWVSRAETSLAYCLIICTSPEINFDVKCLWASGSGPRGGGGSAAPVGEVFATCSNIKDNERGVICTRGSAATPIYSMRSHSSTSNMLSSYSTRVEL